MSRAVCIHGCPLEEDDGAECLLCTIDYLRAKLQEEEAASEKTLALFEDQRKRFGKCREERKAQKEINQIQSAAYQQQYDRLKAAEIRIRELEDPMCDQTDAVHALQAEVARLTEAVEGERRMKQVYRDRIAALEAGVEDATEIALRWALLHDPFFYVKQYSEQEWIKYGIAALLGGEGK